MKTECQMLRDFFSQDLAGDFGHFKDKLDNFEKTKSKGDSNDVVNWWRGRAKITISLMKSQLESTYSNTPSGEEFASIMHSEPFKTSIKKQQEVAGDVVKKGDRIFIGEGDQVIKCVVVGFELITSEIVASYKIHKNGETTLGYRKILKSDYQNRVKDYYR